MCGFVAVLGKTSRNELTQLGSLIEHRGPDEQSSWSDGEVSIVFQRLAIVDPVGSHQPLTNEDESVFVWFNGEIYNHGALRDMLQVSGHCLKERGDGEVISHLYEDYQERFPEYLEGMFAFLVYDRRKKKCLFGRDRYGIKPLFYRQQGNRWMFASETLPLLQSHEDLGLNMDALAEYLMYRYVPVNHHQLVEGIQKVPAGCVMTLEMGKQWVKTIRYYTDRGHVQQLISDEEHQRSGGDSLLVKRVRDALAQAVKRHLMADVPLGVFLSGGVDSAIIVGLTREATGFDAPIHTYTVVFDEGESEGERARQISKFHQTIHHELTITRKQFFSKLIQATLHWGGPVSEPAAIPTMMLAELAKQDVKVVLTGEGADELFVGYPKYEFEHLLARTPLLQSVPSWLIPRSSRRLGRLHDALSSHCNMNRWISWFGAFSEDDMTCLLSSHVRTWLQAEKPQVDLQDESLSGFLKFDRATWLTQNLLHKFDVMTMAASIEARVPFLDSEVVQTALDIPVSRHLLHGTKSLLKESFQDLVPPRYFQSPKNGFRVPVSKWLGELDLERMLGNGSLVANGILNPSRVKGFVQEFRRWPDYHDRRLWTLWALEVWYQLTFTYQQPETLMSTIGAV